MDLQELQTIWNSPNKELDTSIKINKTLFKEVSIRQVRSNLAEFKFSNLFELVANLIFFVLLTGFFIDNYTLAKFSVPAAFLILLSLSSIIFNGYQLYLYSRIDSRFSIIETQRTIERLKYYERLDTNILMVIIPLFASAFLIVAAKAFINFDLYSLGNVLIQFTAGSIVVAAIIVFFLRKFPNKHLQESISFLKEIKEIEDQ